MSEAERYWMRFRLHGARLSKARRGELRIGAPTGYVWDPEARRLRLDPDEQVQGAVRLVFERFRLDGTAGQVQKYFVRHGITFGVRQPNGQVMHKRAHPKTLINILRSPIYAGRRQPVRSSVRRREERAMTTTIDLPHLVESFFRDHLQRVRGASPNTIVSYRDSLKLLLNCLADRTGRRVSELTLDDIEVDQILAFLEHLETERGNSVSTRNLRLAAIRGFVEHLLRHDPTRAGQYRRVLDIPKKKSKPPSVSYLEPEEMKVLLGQPDQTTRIGRAHHALMLFLYNTGARVSEALGVRRQDLHLLRPAQVRLLGKGRKERICPLWRKTADAVTALAQGASQPDAPIFLNARGQPLSRDGVAYVLDKYVALAKPDAPRLHHVRVTPHVFRHSCAVALLQAGLDITVIRDYLGHVSVATTSRYVSTNLRMKREVLEAFSERAGLTCAGDSSWKPTADVLTFLNSL